jgi:hypothetical protein
MATGNGSYYEFYRGSTCARLWKYGCARALTGAQARDGADGLTRRADHVRRDHAAARDEGALAGACLPARVQGSADGAQFDKSIADTLVNQVKTKTTLKVRGLLPPDPREQ